MKLKRSLLAITALIASSGTHANLLTNGSFESGTFLPPSNATMTLSPGATSIAGWAVVNDAIAWIGVGDPWGLDAFNGDRFLDLSDYTAGAPFGGVTQSFSTTAGTLYLVEFSLGSSTFWGRPSALTVSAAGTSSVFTSPLVGGNNDWEQRSMTFVATGGTTALSFIGSAGANYIGLDNVSVTVVPEPSSALLLLLGSGLLLRRLRSSSSR
jgi:Protein of unknown function (DUF642)